MPKSSDKAQAISPELRRRLIILGAKILGIILLFYILLFRIFGFVRIQTNAMSPSLDGGDLALVFHLNGDYSAGDVVNYEHNGRSFTGRIVAKAGDIISVKEGKIYINGSLDESTAYGDVIFPENATISYPYTVAAEQYFILGDNRSEYDDSRSFGAINKTEIKNQVIGIFRSHDI